MQNLSSCFLSFEVHIPHEQNLSADLLSKLATSKAVRFNRTVIHDTVASPIIEENEAYSLELVPEPS